LSLSGNPSACQARRLSSAEQAGRRSSGAAFDAGNDATVT
jgi:hypothetical protein